MSAREATSGSRCRRAQGAPAVGVAELGLAVSWKHVLLPRKACSQSFQGRGRTATPKGRPQQETQGPDPSLSLAGGWTLVLGKWSVRNPNADAPSGRHLAPDVQAPVLLGQRWVWDEGSTRSASSCSLDSQQ